jgi:hypothetical protein
MSKRRFGCQHSYTRVTGYHGLCNQQGDLCRVTGPGESWAKLLCESCQELVRALGWKVEVLSAKPASSPAPVPAVAECTHDCSETLPAESHYSECAAYVPPQNTKR